MPECRSANEHTAQARRLQQPPWVVELLVRVLVQALVLGLWTASKGCMRLARRCSVQGSACTTLQQDGTSDWRG
jgi:hypothetical protein